MDMARTVANLNKKGFIAAYCKSRDILYKEITSHITRDDLLGGGGSMTISDLKLYERLYADGYKVNMPSACGISYEDAMNENVFCDVYFSSVNAMSEDGELVNIDGRGNRVAALSFGPKKIFYIVGKNKVMLTLNDAIDRAKNVAAPLNCKRLGKITPCALSGHCHNCNSPDRICRETVITEYPLSGKETYVYFLNEILGF